jgi:tetratricopeptide (TPR) repeat protein
MDTTFPLSNEYLGSTYIALGRYGEAVPVLRRALEPGQRLSSTLSVLGYALAKSGHRAEAEQIIAELLERQRRGYISPTSLALVHAGVGDTTQVFVWLGRAVEARDPFLIYNYVTYPMMAPFRRDPRGQAILRAMGLSGR